MIQQSINELCNTCVLCGGNIESTLELPNLPFTGVYGKYDPDNDTGSMDQELMLCRVCGHGQLKNRIDISFLYGENYAFRTSASQTSRAAAMFFIDYLDQLFPGRMFGRIVDFGCNDTYLLKQLKPKGNHLLGIDLIWQNKESFFKDDKIVVKGDYIENIDCQKVLGGKPDLIVSQHTMEHILDPGKLLEDFHAMADDEAVFLFEFPCFDLLLQHFRIDQIFHEHLHYFSLNSFTGLLKRLGFDLIDYTFNLSHWGALLIAFKKAKYRDSIPIQKATPCPKIFPDRIMSCYKKFYCQMETAREAVNEVALEGIWGYGAALMLPVLGYHMKTDFSEFVFILDDDPQKDGIGYVNLPVKIKRPKDFDYAGANICLTAIDNRRPILKKLLSKNVKRIINPLNFI